MSFKKYAPFSLIFFVLCMASSDSNLPIAEISNKIFELDSIHFFNNIERTKYYDSLKNIIQPFRMSLDGPKKNEIKSVRINDGCNRKSAACEIKSDTLIININSFIGTKMPCRNNSLTYYRSYLDSTTCRYKKDTLRLRGLSGDFEIIFKLIE